MTLAPDNQESGVPLWAFVASAAVLIVAAFAAVWFAFPAPDTRHDLVSPSGAVRIELAELCGDRGCDRVAILDAGGVRTGCPLTLDGNRRGKRRTALCRGRWQRRLGDDRAGGLHHHPISEPRRGLCVQGAMSSP